MIDLFCPDECVGSVVDIDLDALWGRGFRALIMDLDNTLLAWETEEIPADAKEWIDRAKAIGFKLCIASNGTSGRVMRIANELGLPAIPKAIKPRKRPFRRALEILDVSPEVTAVIGDQIFTDVLGGNRMDLYTILINPMSTEEFGHDQDREKGGAEGPHPSLPQRASRRVRARTARRRSVKGNALFWGLSI